MKFISWNVNGLRACVGKGFQEFFDREDADFFCLQETKLQEGQINLALPGRVQYWNYAQKKGYSGTAIFAKQEPLSVRYGVGVEHLDTEGRLITLEYPNFYLVTCYTPNAQQGLARIDHRLEWDAAFREYLKELDARKPVIACGDLNVAHQEIDLKNPSSNRGSAGFSDEERESFGKLLGRLFQMTDDILDVTGDFNDLGKNVGKDEGKNKLTCIRVYGLDGAKVRADMCARDCHAVLEGIDGDTSFLHELVDYVLNRKN